MEKMWEYFNRIFNMQESAEEQADSMVQARIDSGDIIPRTDLKAMREAYLDFLNTEKVAVEQCLKGKLT